MGSANEFHTPGRTTLLDAVSICLEAIGEQPVNDLENQQAAEVTMAERTLLELHREGQCRGWSWNREAGVEFAGNHATGEVQVGSNIVSWTPDPYQFGGRFQLRGQRVYDMEQHTFQIDPSVLPLRADVVVLLPWAQSPEVFNRWTVARAIRVFGSRVLGSSDQLRAAALDESQALLELQRVEASQSAPNLLTGSPALRPFPTYTAAAGLMGRRHLA